MNGPQTATPSPFRPLGFSLVTGLLVALVAGIALRPLPDARAEQVPEHEVEVANASAPELAKSESTATEQPAEPAAIAPERPLRVTALGWELLGPAVIANDGLSPGEASQFRRSNLAVELAVAHTPEQLAAQLARGGGVAEGADVALLPLPTFVSSYEQLRALSPEVFFVVGWSHGRDALAADRPDLLRTPNPRVDKLALVGAPGQPATLLGLFALDQLGVDLDRVELISPQDARAEHSSLRAIERSLVSSSTTLVDARELVLTSADAPRLIPMVAVARPGSYVTTPMRWPSSPACG